MHKGLADIFGFINKEEKGAMENRKIDVDEAVWELLKKNAASGESPNDILKRLLANQENKKPEAQSEKTNLGKDWSCS